MGHSCSCEAIVLKTYDIGEADRFCILFTRERGRIAARASGARRLQSRLGPSLLPFRHLTVELKEGSAGWVVAGVMAKGVQGVRRVRGPDVTQFTALEEGIELLLRLVTDEGALPEVFDLTLAFLAACHHDVPHASLAYSFALLHCLGLLPGEEQILERVHLDPSELDWLRAAREGGIIAPDAACHLSRLTMLRTLLLEEQISAPLKAMTVAAAMA